MSKKINIFLKLTIFFTLFSTFNVLYSSDYLDYGLYFLGYYDNNQKFEPEIINSYYDPAKPTVIFFHGWMQGSSKKGYKKANFYWEKPSIWTHHSWLDKGWNVAIFHWAQWADEDEVKWAEAKIWSRKGPKGFRYRFVDGTYGYKSNPTGENQAVGEIAKDVIVEALEGNNGNEIRFVGHSLGNQLATRTASLIFEDIIDGKIDEDTYRINRLALLDPAWTKDGKDYLGDINGDGRNDWVGERCRWAIREMIDYWPDMAVEIYNTTALDKQFGFFGDANLSLRRDMACNVSLRPWYYKATQLAEKHNSSIYTYFWSMESSPPVECIIKWKWQLWRLKKVRIPTNQDGPSASTPNWRIRQMMGSGYNWDQVEGRFTLNPNDDWFEIKSI